MASSVQQRRGLCLDLQMYWPVCHAVMVLSSLLRTTSFVAMAVAMAVLP